MSTSSASDRQERARSEFSQFFDECPSRLVLARLSEKWAAIVILTLADGPRRRGALARAVPGATPKMLTQTLRNLERDGFISRLEEPTAPPKVTYALTASGREVCAILDQLVVWSAHSQSDIDDSRARFDAALDLKR